MGKLTSRFNHLCLVLFWSLLPLIFRQLIVADSLEAGESINDTQTHVIVSANKRFELAFFTQPPASSFKYLGIRYKSIPDVVVWVANRDSPIENSSATLNLTKNGTLALFNQTGAAFWSSNSTRAAKDPFVQLLDTGNLVVRDSGSDDYVWQSFDYPSDTLLPGMKLGWDSETGLNRKLTSPRSPSDPSSGGFSLSVSTDGLPQLVVRKGNKTVVKGGPWFGQARHKGAEEYAPSFVYNASFEISFAYHDSTNGPSRVVLDPAGSVIHYAWTEAKGWHKSYTLEGTGCNDYALCGNFGVCSSMVTASCDCMEGFEHISPQNFSDGCIRRDLATCRAGEGFKTIRDVKWPDSTGDLVKMKVGKLDCGAECLKNCSCIAYGILDIPKVGPGCVEWYDKLVDVAHVRDVGTGEDLYVRVAASELESPNRNKRIVVVVVAVVSATIFFAFICYFVIRSIVRRCRENDKFASTEAPIQEHELEMLITTIEAATDNFSISNKIGEGGFGPVYKGKLRCGQEIAVKKLGESSNQGLREFKNEVLLISQLQHRNLVKLLGFCIHKQETLLIYEYMPNKSLDYFIFDEKRRSLLNWRKRTNIIIGIARGLLYLHRDSRLRIVHRDLKVANILLDSKMEPKISDFGMARMFGENQMETRTKRIVGTYGYMSPEYAIDGCFSFKSDIYGFGVILLEIVSGKKNRGFIHPEHHLNLIGHAWKLGNEGRALELIDEMLEEQVQEHEALRYINIGLLCVQRRPEERPSMSSVLSMLENEIMSLFPPEQPGFYEERFITDFDSFGDQLSFTSNNVTDTLVDGR